VKTVQLETDQDTCYDTLGKQVDCQGSGHDAGNKRSGETALANRFKVMGDSVQDTLWGLVWKKHAGLSEFPLSWPEALRFVEELNNSPNPLGNAWRLPNRRELFSLVSHQQVNPSLPKSHPFSDVFNGYYWTGTTCARLPDQAWYVHMGGGRVYRGMKHGSYMVWPVSGQILPAEVGQDRFSTIHDIYSDRHTNRHWYAGGCLLDGPCSWQEALHVIRRINYESKNGYNDWRLPNIRELESLVDDSRHSPAFTPGFSIAIKQIIGFWSSTTSMYEPRYAWVLYSTDGAIGVGFKAQAEFHTLAVRGDIGLGRTSR
jgi:hypothetical protein